MAIVENFYGITSYKIVDWLNDFELELFTDSAGNVNLGSLWSNDWYSLRLFSLIFPVEHSDIFLYIIFFQLFPITMSFEVWGKTLSGIKTGHYSH